ncbi:hypothetical protein Hdeb2414_s0001g00032211 [Helianthus debilis subsp. tardiflorus]
MFCYLFLMLLCFTTGYSLMNVLDPKAGGDDGGDDLDDVLSPPREEVTVLSSEGSDRSLEGLILRSSRAGPPQGAGNEPVNEPAGEDVDVPVDVADQLESQKKKTLDKSEKKKVEESATEAPRNRPSTLPFLDYVVVSDTLSSLDADDKRIFVASGYQGTKFFICKSCFLPFVLVFAYHGCFVTGTKSGKAPRKIEISKITPPTSPPSRTFDLSPPPHDDLGEKKKTDDVEVEQVGEGGAGGDGRGEGVNPEAESSEATPRHTIYTKCPPGSSGGGTSGVPLSPGYENVQAGSWDTHNPACADLPHVPRWNLTQGSRMSYFKRGVTGWVRLDDYIHVGVNFFATSQEITREWQLMGEDKLEFENTKKAFAEERENFNSEKKGLSWRVSNAEEKLAKEKQFNTKKQKEWEIACERTDKELQAQREAIIRLSREKTKISDEAE